MQLNRSVVLAVLLVHDLVLDLVQTDLLGDTLAALAVFATGLVLEDLVNLLERLVTEFGEEENGVEDGDNHEAHEDDVRPETGVVDEHRSDLGWYISF